MCQTNDFFTRNRYMSQTKCHVYGPFNFHNLFPVVSKNKVTKYKWYVHYTDNNNNENLFSTVLDLVIKHIINYRIQ